MSNEKFTKGPWVYGKEGIGVVDKSDTQSYGMLNIVTRVDEYDFANQFRANAYLIAAAPEMYAMLKFLSDELSSVEESIYWPDVHELLEKARGEK